MDRNNWWHCILHIVENFFYKIRVRFFWNEWMRKKSEKSKKKTESNSKQKKIDKSYIENKAKNISNGK